MLAKVIAHGPDRPAALAALDAALRDTEIAGVEHNVDFLRRVLAHPDFAAGAYSTRLIDRAGAALLQEPDDLGPVLAALALQRQACGAGPWARNDGFRPNGSSGFEQVLRFDQSVVKVRLEVGQAWVEGRAHRLEDLVWEGERVQLRLDGRSIRGRVLIAGDAVHVVRDGAAERWLLPSREFDAFSTAALSDRVTSPMPGQVIAVAVAVGDRVAEGAPLVVVEAMKMEHTLRAPRAGRIAALGCAVGSRVEEGVELVKLED
jgi:3-methylcrotonyl-CoA carboxylase alpha subunit